MTKANTQMAAARAGKITPQMLTVAKDEGILPEVLRDLIAQGKVVIPANPAHTNLHPVGFGQRTRIKVNVNLGRSQTTSCLTDEVAKVEAALKYGADAVMDLSTGPDIDSVRKAIIEACPAPLGTVPRYGAVNPVDDVAKLTVDDFLRTVKEQAEQGVDFMTIHAGLLKEH
nr:phosphomethylpyrimidine synthase ThiC [Myxococcota bacterium]